MKLYDMFFKTLECTDDIDKAIKTVEKEILKRKTTLAFKSFGQYEDLNNKIKEIFDLIKKHNLLNSIIK